MTHNFNGFIECQEMQFFFFQFQSNGSMILAECQTSGNSDIHGARVFDGIGKVIRGPEVGSTEGATFKVNVQLPHWIIYII